MITRVCCVCGAVHTQDCPACLQEPLPTFAFLWTTRLQSVDQAVGATQQKLTSRKSTRILMKAGIF